MRASGAEHNKSTGFLPQINQVYFLIDSVLYLWDIVHPEAKPIVFNEVDHVLTSVALLPPKAGCFDEDVDYVLFLVTVSKSVYLCDALVSLQ